MTTTSYSADATWKFIGVGPMSVTTTYGIAALLDVGVSPVGAGTPLLNGATVSITSTQNVWVKSIQKDAIVAVTPIAAVAPSTNILDHGAVPEFTNSTSGVVPASGGGIGKFLRSDGTWASPIAPAYAYNTNSSVSATTVLTAANITGGIAEVTLNLTGAITVASNAQLPVVSPGVATVLTGLGFLAGQSFKLRVINGAGSGSGVWTLTTNTGWGTLNGTMTVAVGAWREFYVTYTSATAMTLQSVGTGTNS